MKKLNQSMALRSLIPLVLLATGTAGVACSGRDEATNDGLVAQQGAAAATMGSFGPEDLAINFSGETEERRSALSLNDLGISAAELQSIRVQTTGLDNPTESEPACLADPSAWRVVGLRFNPYALAVPGQPVVWTDWAAKQGKKIDTMLEMRYVLKPYCKLASDNIIQRDFALHVIYRLAPNELSTKLAKSDDYISLQREGKRDESNKSLAIHIDALNSDEYKAFRSETLLRWNRIAALRANNRSESTLAPTIEKIKSLVKLMIRPGGTSKDILDAKNSPVAVAVKDLTKIFAKRAQLNRVTSMITVGGLRWFFGEFTPDATGSLKSARMLTYQAVSNGASVDLSVVAEQMSQISIGDPASVKTIASDKNVIAAQELSLTTSSEDAVRKEIRTKLLDLSKTNPTTMTCRSCHLIANPFVDGHMEMESYGFHLMAPNGMNVLTATEIENESSRLNKEFALPSIGKVTPTAQDCTIVEPGFSNVREKGDDSVLKASLVNNTKVVRSRDFDGGNRKGIQLSGWVHYSNTSCRNGSPAQCVTSTSVVNASDPVRIGPSSAIGINIRSEPSSQDPNALLLGVVSNGQSLVVEEATLTGWLRISIVGTVAETHLAPSCRQ